MNEITEALKALATFANGLKEKNDPKAPAILQALEALLKALQSAPVAASTVAPQAAPTQEPSPTGMPQRAPFNVGNRPVSRVM